MNSRELLYQMCQYFCSHADFLSHNNICNIVSWFWIHHWSLECVYCMFLAWAVLYPVLSQSIHCICVCKCSMANLVQLIFFFQELCLKQNMYIWSYTFEILWYFNYIAFSLNKYVNSVDKILLHDLPHRFWAEFEGTIELFCLHHHGIIITIISLC